DAHRARLHLRPVRQDSAGARRALGLPSGGPFAAARRTGPDLARYAERYLFRAALLHRLRRIFLRTCALPARAPRMRPRRSRPRPVVCGACGLARPSVAGGRRGGVDGTASLDISSFFLKVGLFSFGGAYAVLP